MAESLWNGGPVWTQAPGVFPLSTDSILLADFASPGPRDRILDLGTGGGILPLLLGWDTPSRSITAVDCDPAACALARENFRQNGLNVNLLEADLRDLRTLFPSGTFDLTVSNPPYFDAGSGYISQSLGAARSEQTCTLEELCTAAAWATRWGGRFCLVFRPERLSQLFTALQNTGFQPKRLRPVHHSPNAPVNLLLIEARRGGSPGLKWDKDLNLYTSAGRETKEILRIYHREKE